MVGHNPIHLEKHVVQRHLSNFFDIHFLILLFLLGLLDETLGLRLDNMIIFRMDFDGMIWLMSSCWSWNGTLQPKCHVSFGSVVTRGMPISTLFEEFVQI